MLRYSIFFFLTFSAVAANAQQNDLKQIVDQERKTNYLSEEIFLHTDKNFHLAGEIIWFKVYVLNKANHTLQDLSKVAYVELIDDKNVPKAQFKVGLENGMGAASFHIPFTFPSGNYRLRAYTNWMKNNPQGFFEENLLIVNTRQTLDTTAFKSGGRANFKFIPEGGQLVSGLENNIVFHLKNENNYSGVLLNDLQDTVLTFISKNKGAGNFKFTPEPGKNYHVLITEENGNISNIPLPQMASSGYTMQLTDAGLALDLAIHTRGTGDKVLYTLVNQGEKFSYAGYEIVNNNNAVFHINKTDLPEGISTVTVYNSSKQPVLQRRYIKSPAPSLGMVLATSNKVFENRAPVTVSIDLKDTVTAFLSASVYRLNELTQPNPRNISNVLSTYAYKEKSFNGGLLNELAMVGPENADFKNPKTSISFLPEMDGNLLTIFAKDKTGKSVADVPVYISIIGKMVEMQHALTNGEGSVTFDLKGIYGPHQVVIRTRPEFENSVEFLVEKQFFPIQPAANLTVQPLKDEMMGVLEKLNNHMVISQSYSGNILDSFMVRPSDSISFYGKPYKTYMLDDYKRFVTVEEVLREYVQEVNVRIKNNDYSLHTFNEQYFFLNRYQNIESMMKGEPLLFLDGVPVFNVNKFMKYDPLKIRKLEVVANRFIVGPQSWDGLLSFTTYKGDLEGFQLNPKDLVIDYKGLENQRIFYSPNYSKVDWKNSRMPDFREELAWEPFIKTANDGKASFSFFTGDVKGKFIVVVQGISEDGKPGYAELEFEVQ